jgi:hypothetical protein
MDSPDLLTEEDYQFLNGCGPTGTQLDLYDSDETTDEFPDRAFYKIPLVGSDQFALVDIVDRDRVFWTVWTLNSSGYVQQLNDGEFLHHRIIGKPSDKRVIDHINGDKMDNRRENLRVVTRSQNARNKGRKKASPIGKELPMSRSMFPGISFQPHKRRYKVRSSVDGVQRHLGYHHNEHMAAFIFAVETLQQDPLIWYREWDLIDLDQI